MTLSVLYFAAAREAAGTDRETLELPAGTVATLRRRLVERHQALGRVLPRCRIAVDQEFVEDGDPVRDGDEVAVIPPVAGGAPGSTSGGSPHWAGVRASAWARVFVRRTTGSLRTIR